MAVRIDASGDYLRRTANLPGSGAFTVAGWFNIVSDRTGQYRYFIALEDAATSAAAYAVLGLRDTNAMGVDNAAGSGTFSSQPSVGQWFYAALYAIGNSTGDLKGIWWNTAGAAVTTQVGGSHPAFTPAALYIGSDSYDEWNGIRCAHVKVWDAALTQAELEAEMWAARPVRYANLNLWAPLWLHTDIADYSGNGRNFTAGGTLTTEDGPPVAWPVVVWGVPLISGGGAGTDNLTVGDFTLGTPVYAAPLLGQIHALAPATYATGAVTYGAPLLAQIHALAAPATFATGAVTFGSPAISQAHVLAAAAFATGAVAYGAPALAQTHALLVASFSAGTPAVGSPALAQIHSLSVAGLTAGTPALDSPALGLQGQLQAAALVYGPAVIPTPALAQIHALAASAIVAGAPVLDSPALQNSGTDNLASVGLVYGPAGLGAPLLGQIHALAASGLVCGPPALAGPAVAQIHALAAATFVYGPAVFGAVFLGIVMGETYPGRVLLAGAASRELRPEVEAGPIEARSGQRVFVAV